MMRFDNGKETVKFLALFDHCHPPQSPITNSKVQRFNHLINLTCLTVLTCLALLPIHSHANVYPTNIRLNGGVTNIVASSVTNVGISYTLNEPALLGVTININSGAGTVRTIALASPAPGTLQGSNYVVWDGRNDANNPVGGGIYSVSITAASSGYTNWTQTSSDTNNLEYEVWLPRGIAVNRNTNSPYYGRIFISNANQGLDPVGHPGDRVGILKFNADGTYADEGGYSTGGYDWAHGRPDADGFSPWKLEVGPDDRLYANDFLDEGLIFSFDQLVATNSLVAVLRPDNYPTNSLVFFSGLFVSGSAGNMQLWMTDDYVNAGASGAGIHRWNLTGSGIVATNDMGVTVVQPFTAGGLDQAPEDVAVDSSNRIYAVQDIENQGDSSWRVLRFPAFTNVTETNAEWRVGSGNDAMAGASGIAVDSTSTYLAVAFKGYDIGFLENGSVSVFYASNGAPVVSFNAGNDHYDAAWDNVGNLYAVDGHDGRWRTYSPPGTNQATTVAIPTVQIATATVPVLSNPAYNAAASQFRFTLTGDANATYIILSSTNFVDWSAVTTNTSPLAVRQITNNVSGSKTFFRARVGP